MPFQKIIFLWFPVVVALLAINLLPPGAQFDRSYFIGYPLFILGILFLLAPRKKDRWHWFVFSYLLMLYSVETFIHLKEQRAVFHSLSQVCSLLKDQGQIALFEQEHHSRVQKLLDSECPAKKQNYTFFPKVGQKEFEKKKIQFLMAGPDLDNILPHGSDSSLVELEQKPIKLELLSNLVFYSQGTLILREPIILPFWGLYPLLMFENKTFTWKFIRGNFDSDTYQKEEGGIFLWPVVSDGFLDRRDINGDGHPDILFFYTSNKKHGFLYVSLWTPSGFAHPTEWLRHGASKKEQLKLADVNGDHLIDAIYFDRSRSKNILVSLSTGAQFLKWKKWAGPENFSFEQWFFSDVNGDKKEDLVFWDMFSSKKILVSLSTGTKFQPPIPWSESEFPLLFWNVSDVDGDGKGDFLSLETDPDQTTSVFVGLSTGSQFSPRRLWVAQGQSTPDLFSIYDKNKDGKSDLLFYDQFKTKKISIFYSEESSFEKRKE